jgi:hypothetical protein
MIRNIKPVTLKISVDPHAIDRPADLHIGAIANRATETPCSELVSWKQRLYGSLRCFTSRVKPVMRIAALLRG